MLALATIGPVQAGGQHHNQVTLQKISATTLRFDFQINPAPWLHQLISPQKDFPDFLKTQAAVSESDFRKSIDKAVVKLEKESFLQLPSGERLTLRKWQLPPTAELQDMLRKNLLLLDLPPQFQAHLEPVGISASAQSGRPLNRIQLTLSPVFFPVLLQHQQDMVWFTPFIPTSLIDL